MSTVPAESIFDGGLVKITPDLILQSGKFGKTSSFYKALVCLLFFVLEM